MDHTLQSRQHQLTGLSRDNAMHPLPPKIRLASQVIHSRSLTARPWKGTGLPIGKDSSSNHHGFQGRAVKLQRCNISPTYRFPLNKGISLPKRYQNWGVLMVFGRVRSRILFDQKIAFRKCLIVLVSGIPCGCFPWKSMRLAHHSCVKNRRYIFHQIDLGGRHLEMEESPQNPISGKMMGFLFFANYSNSFVEEPHEPCSQIKKDDESHPNAPCMAYLPTCGLNLW